MRKSLPILDLLYMYFSLCYYHFGPINFTINEIPTTVIVRQMLWQLNCV